jgi:hypothetical protein
MASSLVQQLQAQLAKYPSLDPRAVLAIASHEGLGGGIGDQGTSFGPFQLHWGGAYPGSAPHGSQQAAQAWAWSPAGIDYALNQIQSVAGGLRGRAAIENISRRFERPANPAAEIADALAHYGGPLPAGGAVQYGAGVAAGRPSVAMGPGLAAARAPAPAPAPRGNPLLASLIGQANQSLGLGGSPMIGQLLAGALARR